MIIKISVRNLVEFILRSGDIDNRQTTGMQAEAMQRGSRMHRKLQKLAGAFYQAEVPLKMEFTEEHYTIILEGRADGIIESEQLNEQELLFIGVQHRTIQKMAETEAAQKTASETESVQKTAETVLKTESVQKTAETASETEAAQKTAETVSEIESAQKTSETEAETVQVTSETEAETVQALETEAVQKTAETSETEAETVQASETEAVQKTAETLETEAAQKTSEAAQETGKTCAVTVDEIKGVFFDISQMTEPVPLHLAQAKCYAFIYAYQHHMQEIGVRMTYANLDTEEVRYFYICYAFEELEQWFLSLMQEYKKWAQFQYEQRMIRQESIKGLEFPFAYRRGQKDLVSGVYRTIIRQKNLFIQAPTGTGKTISTLFPAVKAVGEGYGDKIFYLTAKTITAAVAKETLDIFYAEGYRAKTVQITAKEKMCLMEETACNPDACPYAKGHYDRVNEAVFKLLHQAGLFMREHILEQAQKYMVCPFELCLDTASWVDNIICDYNYVFDPKVYLKRFFSEGVRGDYLFLVDEAHNLVERGRSMYSAELYKEDFLAVKKLVKSRSIRLAAELNKCNKIMLDYKRECEQYQYHKNISVFVTALMRLSAEYEKFLQKYREFEGRDTVLELYFQVRRFLDVCDILDDNYVIYSEHEEERFHIKLYCVDPSRNLQQRLDKGRSTIFFSATLLPIQYYKSLLSTREDNYAIYAETVFRPQQQLLLIGNDVTSRYTRRSEEEYERMAEYIYQTGIQKKGNYIVFFPSYRMMEDVYESFLGKITQRDTPMDCIVQKSGMIESDREGFLAEFMAEREHSMIAFCIMGGIFGEGIDLKQEQLIGALIIGTGLPQVGNEREILKQFYDQRSGSGFDYAYRYPGMNKVLQAAGRVIRTVSDVGIIELLDDRFLRWEYRALFPREWSSCQICNVSNVAQKLQDFWSENERTL